MDSERDSELATGPADRSKPAPGAMKQVGGPEVGVNAETAAGQQGPGPVVVDPESAAGLGADSHTAPVDSRDPDDPARSIINVDVSDA